MLLDDEAIAALADTLNKSEVGASSNWRAMHAEFQYRCGGFSGLRGFGGAHPSGWFRNYAHGILQRPYRRLGWAIPRFHEMDALAAEIAKRQGRAYDLDILRQALTLAWLGGAGTKPGEWIFCRHR